MPYRVSDKSIWPNQCLPWLRLSMEERETVLENNNLKCKICLRHLKNSDNRGGICKNGHIESTGKNGSCWNRSCDYNVTMCREHYNENKERHSLLIELTHNLSGSTCLSSCRLEKIQNPPVRKCLKA